MIPPEAETPGRPFDPRLVLGVLLIAGGCLFLLQNFNLLPATLGWLWALVMTSVGAGFLWIYLNQRTAWWALIPAMIFFDLAVLIALGDFWPAGAQRWGGALFLLGLAAPFWTISSVNRAQWWGLIPAGVLTTLGVVAGLGNRDNGWLMGGVFFLGLGATFVLVWWGSAPAGRRRWAIYPAVGLLLLGVLVSTPLAAWVNYGWPLLLILGGLVLLARTFWPRPR